MGQRRTFHPAVRAGLPVLGVGVLMLGSVGVCAGYPCFSTGIRYGMWVDQCPATDLRLDLSVSADDLLRGQEHGGLFVRPEARWLSARDRGAWEASHVLNRGFRVDATLLDDAGTEVEGLALGRLRPDADYGRRAAVTLPELPDGHYTLKVAVDAGFEAAEVDVDLPLFTPALVHVMTDRPLYKPGQEVLFRSVTLERTDQGPLEGRPGRWVITDPEGNEMLVEKDRAGPWGIADGSFPLDTQAAVGTWSVAWRTGDAWDLVQFDVRPFRLPRFTVDVEPTERWYGIGDPLRIEGHATYTSGAPVGDAAVRVMLRTASGRWPMPVSWEEPITVTTAADGAFEVDLGPVPADLMDRTTLTATALVTESTGETAQGTTTVVLSKDDLLIKAVTELGDGLVGGFNNRAYLRVATPDDRPISGARITVTNPFAPTDPSKEAVADVDGVASIQLDPGDPVTVVDPAPPYRPRPVQPDPVQVDQAEVHDREGLRNLDMAERRAIDSIYPAIASCGVYAIGNALVEVVAQFGANGIPTHTKAPDNELGRCVAGATRSLRFPAGAPRTVHLVWNVPDSKQPWLVWSEEAAFGTVPMTKPLNEAGKRARSCLSQGQGVQGAAVFTVHWSASEDRRSLDLSLDPVPGSGLSPATLGCLRSFLRGITLDAPAREDAIGVARVRLAFADNPGNRAPQATTRTAYELKITASTDGSDLGEGRLVVPPGEIPPLRMRATPSLAQPGDKIVVDLLRGPSFYGELPETLDLYEGTQWVAEADVEDNSAVFTLPDDVDGFLRVEWGSAQTVVFVQRPDPLSVTLQTDAASYRPGDVATLTVTTTANGGPQPAGVGLVGVDSALGQLAPLLGPDDYGRVTVRATSDRPAFDAFDPRALRLGQIAGENAAKAAVLRISNLPMDPAGDAPAHGDGQVRAMTEERRNDNFYRALSATVARVRIWEAEAEAGATMGPAQMVEMYDDALDDLDDAGDPAVDGFGRPLTLDLLPPELLEQVDPRRVVADATRLPEDIESFTRYVDEEVAR